MHEPISVRNRRACSVLCSSSSRCALFSVYAKATEHENIIIWDMMLQLEETLIRGESNDLVSFLRNEGLTAAVLTRLDQCVIKAVCGTGFSKVLVALKSLQILSESKDDLQTLVSHGFIAKILLWFEAVRNLLTSDLHKSSASILDLAEEFFSYYRVLSHSSVPANELSAVLLQLTQFALESNMYFPVKLEAIRTLNSILESVSQEQKGKIQNDKNQEQMQSQLATAVVSVGDYELQVSLTEALCRLTPRKQRPLKANGWFVNDDIGRAFCDIRDRDFEVDCRRFLNCVNSSRGNHRKVYTFPCVRAYLDQRRLFQPKDEKLDGFWIDFNVESECVSFFVDDPQGFLWGSIHLFKDEVRHYTLLVKGEECTGSEIILSIQLNNPVMHDGCKGLRVEITFSSEHERGLREATEKVFKNWPSCLSIKESTEPVPTPTTGPKNHVTFSRKKPRGKSQLKVLPLSSPSSDDDPALLKTPRKSTAELLFETVVQSTPKFESRIGPCGSAGHEEDFEDSPKQQESVSGSNRKRTFADSGFLSELREGSPAEKTRSEAQSQEIQSPSGGAGEENSCLDLNSVFDSLEEAAPPSEEVGPTGEGEKSEVIPPTPAVEPQSELTSDISSAFQNFREQLEQHLTSCMKKVEQEVHQSLLKCQQQVSSLLTAVHHQRLLLLKDFEKNISDQLRKLEENSTHLNQMNTRIKSYFQSELLRLGSFCDHRLNRLKFMESGFDENLPENVPNQEEKPHTPETVDQ